LNALSHDLLLAKAADSILDAGRRMDRFGWVPSFGGNLSVRLDDKSVAITRSGCRKGFLTRGHVIKIDLDGNPLREGCKSSAETLLHCQIYDLFPWVGAVLHGHSVAATVLSRLASHDGIRFAGYEMIKAFEGQLTHETAITLPVLRNSQDMRRLRTELASILPNCMCGYVLQGHGVYVWGRDMEQAISNLEALEFLLACELEVLMLQRS
jgi:methylthioribulose-1-phosphate dehydratase